MRLRVFCCYCCCLAIYLKCTFPRRDRPHNLATVSRANRTDCALGAPCSFCVCENNPGKLSREPPPPTKTTTRRTYTTFISFFILFAFCGAAADAEWVRFCVDVVRQLLYIREMAKQYGIYGLESLCALGLEWWCESGHWETPKLWGEQRW